MGKIETSKPNKRSFVSVDPDKCVGCGLCEYACALEKEGFPDPLMSRIRVIRVSPLLNVAMTCRFCDNAPCVIACPREALKQSEENGFITVDEERCDACGWCIETCPYGGIIMHPTKHVVAVCDLCGGEPKCVEFCPMEALELISDPSASEKRWISAIEKLPTKMERLTSQIKRKDFTEVFKEAENAVKRIEERLEMLNKTRILALRRERKQREPS